ncbi:MAG: hypothetical protein WA086_11005 [Ideonella sp.]
MPTEDDRLDGQSPSHHEDLLDDCLRGLRGAAPGVEPTAAHHFGALLRERLQAEDSAMKASQRAADDALVARWRAQGLFQGRPHFAGQTPSKWTAARAWWKGGARWLLPTSAMAMLSLWLWPSGPHVAPSPDLAEGDSISMRGGESAQRLNVAEPSRMAAQLEEVLQRHGLRFSRRALSNGTVQIQAMVPLSEGEARQSLQALGVQVPAHGRMDLLIVPLP